MRKIRTEIDIAAPPERVWAVLTDFAAYPRWNPFIKSIAGTPAVGERLTVSINLPGRSAMTFKPVVKAAQPARELRWRGTVLMRGIFDGEHFFLVQPSGADGTHFIHGEVFSGLLVGLFSRMFDDTEAAFRAMNDALKEQAESA